MPRPMPNLRRAFVRSAASFPGRPLLVQAPEPRLYPLPIRVGALPGAEPGVVVPRIAAVALAQVEALVVHDVVPHVVVDVRRIKHGGDPDDPEHGAAEPQPAGGVPDRPRHVGVLYVPGLEHVIVQQPLHGVHEAEVLPHVGPGEVPGPLDVDGTILGDEVRVGDVFQERLRLRP